MIDLRLVVEMLGLPQHQRRPSSSGGLFLSKKVPLPERMAAIVRKPCREEQHPGNFRAQKCPKHASVLTAKVCSKLVSHGKSFWQRPLAMRHDTQSQELF